MEKHLEILDLSGQKLTKLAKAQHEELEITTLILDENDLQKLDHIDSFPKLQKLSVVRNQLIRMYGVSRLHSLTTLNLAHNGIITIEGLKELVQLKCLCLAGNNIKTIEHLHTNVNLEHLDLSENNITHVSDISYLKNLKELLIHGNRIGHLRQCERYLPSSLVTLTLASNNIADLNEISQLVHLINLSNFSITGNPCVCMTGNKVGFDYRPFVINWLMSLKVIDGYVVDAIESLRAEWLYSQGRGRHFRTGDHQELIQYLASVCPPSGETLQTEEERKLRLILSKAQHHQQQLRDQLNANGSRDSSPVPSPNSKRKMSRIAPRGTSRMKPKSPDRMATSCIISQSTGNHGINSPMMSQSLDPSMFSDNIVNKLTHSVSNELNGISQEGQLYASSPLQAATKLVPVPESLMSPDFRPPNIIPTRMPVPSRNHSASPQNRPVTTAVHPQPKKDVSRNNSPKMRTPNSSPRQQRSVNSRQSNLTSSPLRTRKTTSIPPYNSQAEACQVPRHHNGNYVPASTHCSPQANNSVIQSSDDESEMCESKLMTIRHLAQERRAVNKVTAQQVGKGDLKTTLSETDAAVKIQKLWRGYHCRNLNDATKDILKQIKDSRTREYIEKLATDMEKAKETLECERKIRVLQMQAINALWQKVTSIQGPENADGSSAESSRMMNSGVSSELMILTKTCTELAAKVNNLQGSLDEVKHVLKALCLKSNVTETSHISSDTGISTQTEIIAVHTPQGEAAKMFPYQRTPRPSSLPLSQPLIQSTSNESQVSSEVTEEVQEFIGNLVNDAMKTINETDSNGNSPTLIADESEPLKLDTFESGTTLSDESNKFSLLESQEEFE